MPTIHDAYLFGREHLAAAGSTEAAIEAEVLLRHALRVDRAGLFTRWEQPVPAEAWIHYRRLLDDRATGRPVPYVVGEREFMGMSFAVDERVMIPRPETELLVEFVMTVLKAQPYQTTEIAHRGSGSSQHGFERSGREGDISVVDVGTGSGCIAVSLARMLPRVTIYAIDVSRDALDVARLNAARHGVEDRVELLHGDLLGPLPPSLEGRIAAIVSNPPYVPMGQRDALPREIREFEPAGAVFMDGDGSGLHRRLVTEAPRWLRRGGLLAMEVGADQADAVASIMRGVGKFASIRTLPDYAGIPRVVAGELTA